MLQKEALVKFIEKSYLNNTINSFVIESQNGALFTEFKSPPAFRGNVTMHNYKIDDGEIGVYNPDKLLKILSFLENDINVNLDLVKEEVKAIKFKDKKNKLAKYATADVGIIPRADKNSLKNPNFSVKINLNSELISDILKANSVIGHHAINFCFKNDKLFAIFGQSKNNTDQIEMEIECENIDDIGNLPFSSAVLQPILSINSKKFKEGTIEINVVGTMRIKFEEGDITSEYFLKSLPENN